MEQDKTRKCMIIIGISKRPRMFKHFPKRSRKYIYKNNFHNLGCFQMSYKACLSKKTWADWLFSCMGFNHGWLFLWKGKVYTKKQRKGKEFLRPYCIAEVTFKPAQNRKYDVTFNDIKKISHYKWFCPKRKRETI